LTASASLAACAGASLAPSWGWAQAPAQEPRGPSDPEVDALLRDTVSVDLHSHGGRLLRPGAPFEPLAAPMRAGGLSALCLAIVADATLTHYTPGIGIKQVREPAPGQLVAWGKASFARARALIADQRLATVRTLADLDACRTAGPGAIVTSEGGDFLDGSLARLDEAYNRHDLRQLQLVHYRVNELGDIQTESPRHYGLTKFGADAVRACNRLGIVIDVAHATFDTVKQVVALTGDPVVLSHTSLAAAPPRLSRRITRAHARAVAATGGVVGVWPAKPFFSNRAEFVTGIAEMVDAAGIDHVGIGTDMMGLPSGSVFEDYGELPALIGALRATGFAAPELAKILGGNYRRVFAAVTRAA
jgi:membrane dipeptidase